MQKIVVMLDKIEKSKMLIMGKLTKMEESLSGHGGRLTRLEEQLSEKIIEDLTARIEKLENLIKYKENEASDKSMNGE